MNCVSTRKQLPTLRHNPYDRHHLRSEICTDRSPSAVLVITDFLVVIDRKDVPCIQAPFFTSALNGGELPVLRSGHFIPAETVLGALRTADWLGPDLAPQSIYRAMKATGGSADYSRHARDGGKENHCLLPGTEPCSSRNQLLH
jgi:hypothetical protein